MRHRRRYRHSSRRHRRRPWPPSGYEEIATKVKEFAKDTAKDTAQVLQGVTNVINERLFRKGQASAPLPTGTGMTPEAYIAAVKACPRVAWVKNTRTGWNTKKELFRGHAVGGENDWISVISDDDLSSKELMRRYAEWTTDASHLYVSPLGSGYYGHSNREHERYCFFGQIPPEEQLRAYFVSKHGNPRELNWLPRGELNLATIEWVEEQADKLRAYFVSKRGNPLGWRRALNLATAEWVEEQAAKQYAQKEAARDAARQAARDAELRKRSYWAFLDGYAFERATAEVMQKHQFTAMVTPGSGDGGVDIQVTRNGLKGVVQCKAHVACVGPHVVRDLYGVIHHCGADFGIIVSRGGFTRGAVEFARDKPILFLDISDLIAMQEGRDVLASAFSDSQSARAND